jgi:hypothetical protein
MQLSWTASINRSLVLDTLNDMQITTQCMITLLGHSNTNLCRTHISAVSFPQNKISVRCVVDTVESFDVSTSCALVLRGRCWYLLFYFVLTTFHEWECSEEDNIRECVRISGPPLCSSGQSSWLLIQRYRVRFPALPDFLSSSGSGTGSTQPL